MELVFTAASSTLLPTRHLPIQRAFGSICDPQQPDAHPVSTLHSFSSLIAHGFQAPRQSGDRHTSGGLAGEL